MTPEVSEGTCGDKVRDGSAAFLSAFQVLYIKELEDEGSPLNGFALPEVSIEAGIFIIVRG